MSEKKKPKRHIRPSRKTLPEFLQGGPVMLDGRGRELTVPEVEAIETMAEQQCSLAIIAAVLKIHERTVFERYGHLISESKDRGKQKLIHVLWKKATVDEDVKVMIWLSKQYLGMKESWPEVPQTMNYNVNIVEVPR